jgi:hypothetical protein
VPIRNSCSEKVLWPSAMEKLGWEMSLVPQFVEMHCFGGANVEIEHYFLNAFTRGLLVSRRLGALELALFFF